MINSRLLFSSSVVGFTFLLVIISALRVAQPSILSSTSSKPVLALMLDNAQQTQEATIAAKLFATTPSGIDYPLPYPGILPDHPLYWAKMVRDRIALWLTLNTGKKASLLLTYADKRLGAAQSLILGGQPQLGLSTLTKAEKYLAQAQISYDQALAKGKVDKSQLDLLAKAFLKHQEVMKSLDGRVSDNERETLQNSLHFTTLIYEGMINKYQLTPSPVATPASTGTN